MFSRYYFMRNFILLKSFCILLISWLTEFLRLLEQLIFFFIVYVFSKFSKYEHALKKKMTVLNSVILYFAYLCFKTAIIFFLIQLNDAENKYKT